MASLSRRDPWVAACLGRAALASSPKDEERRTTGRALRGLLRDRALRLCLGAPTGWRKRAFCKGDHGSFVGRGVGVCVRYNKADMEMKSTKSD